MASKYRAKFSRSQKIVNLALENENSSPQRNDLGYENDDFIENSDDDLSSPLPFGASEILENCSLSLLKDICFENDLSYQEKQNDTELENSTLVVPASMSISNSKLTQHHDKGTHSDNHEKENNTDLYSNGLSVQQNNDYSYKPIASSSSIVITNNNYNLSGKDVFQPSVEHQSEELIQNTELLDDNDMRDIDNVTPIPSSTCSSFGEEEPIPSVPSLLSNASAFDNSVACVSQYYSSNDVSTPTRPKKRKLTKKRDSGRLREKFRNEWIDSKRKKLKNSGQAYSSRNGKLRDGKQLGEPCQSTCKLKCFEKLDEGTRTAIFNQFWMIGDHSEQYNFIVNYVVRINKKRTVTQAESRRLYTYVYYLPITQNNQKTKLVVCKTMFLNTISCGPKMIRTAMNKFAATNRLTLVDNRGRHEHHKTSVDAEMIKSVLDHVKSFEPVDSHYCRKDSNKLYLDGSLSFIRMFKLYKEWYDPTKYSNKCESLRQYRDIVNKNINLSFHQPKKDQCHVCHSFKNGPVTPENKIYFDNHIINKNLARSSKEKDKRDSQNDTKIFCATFDLQKVLLSPSGEISLFYYSKRLKVYNLSVFDIGNLIGTCYLWNEQIAMKGSNEIASCVYDIIKHKSQEGCNDFRFWSDNCTGQNRNRIMFFMYLYAAKEFNLNIKHSFLEVGHTQNEGDSIHATIERASKYKNIYTPSEWSSLIRWAKSKGRPYNVINVPQNMIYNFKKMQTNTQFNWTKNSEGQKILWSKIKQIRVNRDESYVLYYKYDLGEDSIENYIKILDQSVSVRTRRRIADRPTDIPLQPCYNQLLPIQPSKKKDLLDLCRKNIIPSLYHNYYANLVASNDIVTTNDSENEDNQ